MIKNDWTYGTEFPKLIWLINVRIDHHFDHRQEFYLKNVAVMKRKKKGKKHISHKNGKIKNGEMAAVNVSKRNFQKQDLKSRDGNIVPVRPRPRAPISSKNLPKV